MGELSCVQHNHQSWAVNAVPFPKLKENNRLITDLSNTTFAFRFCCRGICFAAKPVQTCTILNASAWIQFLRGTGIARYVSVRAAHIPTSDPALTWYRALVTHSGCRLFLERNRSNIWTLFTKCVLCLYSR